MAENFISTGEYVASEQLLASVNVAIALKKPLLVKGEPGTGKTMLAEAVAKSLGKKLIIWNIKSTTKAQEGLYTYDTIQRLYDGQFGEEGVDDIAHGVDDEDGREGHAREHSIEQEAEGRHACAHPVDGRGEGNDQAELGNDEQNQDQGAREDGVHHLRAGRHAGGHASSRKQACAHPHVDLAHILRGNADAGIGNGAVALHGSSRRG